MAKIIQKNNRQNNSFYAKEDVLELIKECLIDTLRFHDDFLLRELNDDLIELMADDQKFQKELEKALYSNQEKLTHKKFILDGKPHSPSVGNWLKDFIKKNGSGMFDNLVLTKYVTNSENTKTFDAEEKKLVGKLLELYRNLKFFPESMGDLPPEKWEIIPLDKEEIISKPRLAAAIPKSQEENNLDDLQNLLTQYPEGSLERKVIEEEMDRRLR